MSAVQQCNSLSRERPTGGLGRAALVISLGALGWAVFWHTVLSTEALGTSVVSRGTWRACVSALGGSMTAPAVSPPAEGVQVRLEFTPVLLATLSLALVSWFAGALLIRSRQCYGTRLAVWGCAGWIWWWLPGAWESLRIVGFMTDWGGLQRDVLVTAPYWIMLSCGGWLATGLWLVLAPLERGSDSGCRSAADATTYRGQNVKKQNVPFFMVVLGCVVYVAVFATMNWQLYENLLVPHGDSAMYEEHLWNVTHGKGFRSYLDQGLFLGEHIQVIHLLLIPLHWIWPSHLLLEVCESLALAVGALPVFWIARRHTGQAWPAAILAMAWFLYPPLQFLDIAIDLKTFRPTSFGAPLLLFAIDQWERGRWKTFVLLALLTLACKEDYAIPLCLLGVWIAVMGRRDAHLRDRSHADDSSGVPTNERSWRTVAGGLCLAASSGLYLLWATRVAIPWFREGQEVHYARYFSSEFGESLGEIAWNMLTQPGLLWSELGTVNSLNAVLALLVPLGLLPLASPTRLLVAVPTLGLLCLNELSQQPHHHFHAPLVPIMFWAAAAGLCRVSRLFTGIRPFARARSGRVEPQSDDLHARSHSLLRPALLGPCCALLASVMSGISPLSTSFWDSSSLYYWRHLYVINDRARAFDAVFASIPQSARVASTDFVHPRFTHHERSYDYSAYRRRVSNYELRVPDDTDYIVIDTGHYYSTIKRPEDIPELHDHPERWELLPIDSSGTFLVLRRRPQP